MIFDLLKRVTSILLLAIQPDRRHIENKKYIGQGLNETNVSLSALAKEEYLFGIISPPEVKSDVFIDRSVMSIMDMHLRLSEIKNLGELTRYGNGYYNITRI